MKPFATLRAWLHDRTGAAKASTSESVGGSNGAGQNGTGAGGQATKQADLQNLSKQTKKMMGWLLGLAAAGFILLLVLAFQQKHVAYFLAWSVIAAGAALVIGGALGLLFGLPTASAVVIAPAAASTSQTTTGNFVATGRPASGTMDAGQTETPSTGGSPTSSPSFDPSSLGYRESTSLEQVADWLTKIIIGLTLTQYNIWEAKFERMATNLTTALFYGSAPGTPPPQASPIPGGMLLAFYAIIGFVVSYLWMRRFFILEMVTARRDAIEAMARRGVAEEQRANLKLLEDRELAAHNAIRRREQMDLDREMETARARGLAARAPVVATSPPPPSIDDLKGVLEKAKALVPPGSSALTKLTTLIETLPEPKPEPDDPWRGKFGGKSSAAGASLEAAVSPTSNPSTFKVDLVVRGGKNAAGTKVLYFLHHTFGLEPRVSILGADDRAPLQLYAWGAFTVGALLEDGTTLELNLATLPGAPDLFRTR